ncbi:MAG: squalene--hopene cyclase [Deltaproteobacteria bacterium]|nr:squalene--hopene cyclase [Deltaproteobacteria bacterium]
MKKKNTLQSAFAFEDSLLKPALDECVDNASKAILSQQFQEGFWWYTLEANESINAEFIFLLHWIGLNSEYTTLIQSLSQRIESSQNPDGSWSLYHDGPGELSTTIECYLALKLSGHSLESSNSLYLAKEFILKHGGLTQCRAFTRIHLALFGLIPWENCPSMPVSFVLFPHWFPLNIYEFSSWARACIVPLLVVQEKKFILKDYNPHYLDELYVERNPQDREWDFKNTKGLFSLENLFFGIDKLLKVKDRFIKIQNPFNKIALKKAEKWILDHVSKTEDIYPALAYSLLALKALNYPTQHPLFQKCLKALFSFQQKISKEIDVLPTEAHEDSYKTPLPWQASLESTLIYQQCCISPVWDTPWAGVALAEAGIKDSHPALIKAARWLLTKQITQTYGDWSIKNKKAPPGGWSFEFENDYFPDVDDTVQVLAFLFRVDLPREQITAPFQRGLDWIFSMQSKNGGWAAFDMDNTKSWVNKIPFSDHGACLDPPSPDLTARVLEFLGFIGYSLDHPACAKAFEFLRKTQEMNGSWEARWAVNYIFGTSSALQGLSSIGLNLKEPMILKAVHWLKSIQNEDGGWSESCESYNQKRHIPLPYSTASQTAWAILGLVAAGEEKSEEVRRGVEFLINTQNEKGTWDEEAFTGTGFPGHFYIRYHGYRHYFPLLALAKYRSSMQSTLRVSHLKSVS